MSYEIQRVRKYATIRLMPVSQLNAFMDTVVSGSSRPEQSANAIRMDSQEFRFTDEPSARTMLGYIIAAATERQTRLAKESISLH